MLQQMKAKSIRMLFFVAAVQMHVLTYPLAYAKFNRDATTDISDADFGLWQQKLPRTDIPPVLLSRRSGLRLGEVQMYDSLMSEGLLARHSSHLCASANLLCNQTVKLQPLQWFGNPHPGRAEEQLFFSLEELQEGSKMTLLDLEDQTNGYAFLPRVLAAKLPISDKSLRQLKNDLRISEGSNMSKTMDMVAKFCDALRPHDEGGKCINSLDEVVEYVLSKLGSNVQVLSQPIQSGYEIVTIRKVESFGSSHVACHSFVFPYGVYYCHSMKNTTAYKVWVMDSNGKVMARPAFCHWHLGNKASKTCHFLFGSHIGWVSRAWTR